ncbi:MAG: hypothetical protein GQ574_19590 [Crocinitomix sp.]|nr:hypothetical protein [Crocinitomix sp.]
MIKIKYNCPESSAEMTETNCGKFCNSCQPEVHDFRKNSIEEIIQIRADNPSVKCGMFTSQQAVVDSRTAIQNVFRMAFAAIFILGFNTTMLFGQINTASDSLNTITETVTNKIIISGVLTDQNGGKITGKIKYTIGEEAVTVETNDQGQFEFELRHDLLGKKIVLRFYSHGYATKYITTTTELQAKCHTYQIELVKKADQNRGNNVLLGFF